ncbi:hypothetical protein [Escherichia coli]|uniref:hypothetical protein n=1 Tax=Escherichia coli TaxID=562 RepID=UPI00295EC572|nr:hypothetical protein [Escherichia coli]
MKVDIFESSRQPYNLFPSARFLRGSPARPGYERGVKALHEYCCSSPFSNLLAATGFLARQWKMAASMMVTVLVLDKLMTASHRLNRSRLHP